MGKRRKLNIIQNEGQSQAKEQSIESSTEVNQNNNSILEENAQFEGEQHIQEDSHVQSHTSLESASESSTKGKKRTRGYTHMLDVWDLPDGEFILVEVDHWGNPMGWEGKTLLNAIGSLVRRHQCAPINFLSWKDMPKDYITDMVELIQSKFRFVPELTEQTKKILIDDMSLKWRQFKYELKSKGYDESKTKEEMIAHIPYPRVDPSQYRDLVHYWCSEKGQKISNINKRSRSKYEDLHCMGTNNLPRRIHEMTTKAKGVQPSRAEIYIDTRTRKDGSIVTEKAAIVIDELKKKMVEAESLQNLQSTQDSTDWTNDIYSKVKGPEKRGCVHCLGKLPHQANSSQSSYTNNRIQKLENLLGNLVAVFKVRFAEDPQINQVLEAIDQEMVMKMRAGDKMLFQEHDLDGKEDVSRRQNVQVFDAKNVCRTKSFIHLPTDFGLLVTDFDYKLKPKRFFSPARFVSGTKAFFSLAAKTCHYRLLLTIVVAGVRDRWGPLEFDFNIQHQHQHCTFSILGIGIPVVHSFSVRRREYLYLYLGGLLSSGLSIHQLHSSSFR
ncbi:hypothetical protein D0Y65_017567 [Glycine soja]|uniref:Uncharacterized protein n=1 Tax=Glycine soja TaxID=3848 RepID=A0A445JVH4_GLYSO|nr:hypothetical protein D0Y65_017567 [Glycine soja]